MKNISFILWIALVLSLAALACGTTDPGETMGGASSAVPPTSQTSTGGSTSGDKPTPGGSPTGGDTGSSTDGTTGGTTGGPVDNVDATPDPRADIEAAINNFHTELRYLMETLDTSRITGAAAGEALEDRYAALNVLAAASAARGASCHWEYNFRSLTVTSVTLISDTRAEATGETDSAGTVFCGATEYPEYAFDGQFTTNYVVEFLNGKWIVTNYGAE